MDVIGFVKKLLGWTWKIIQGIRTAMSLILFIVIVVVILASLAPDIPQVSRSTALVLAPEGNLVDELSGDPIEQAVADARGQPVQETLLRDLLKAIRSARDDDRVKVIVLRLDGLANSGLSKLQAIGDELLAFKESGKPVIAIGDSFTRDQFYVAAHADEIYMHPMGSIFIDGYSRYQPYLRTALENLSIDMHVWRVGEYKSFVEPFSRDDMSAEDEESASEYLEALWDAYQADVTAARGLAPDALQDYADNIIALLEAAGGDTARLAVEQGLVDELLSRSEAEERIKMLVDGENDDENDYPQIDHTRYLRAVNFEEDEAEADDTIAVLVASGMILDGEQPAGTIGGDSTSAMIRDITDDEDIKALVLRVDSPGGSAFASELILSELEEFQQTGRPLVVSMGSVAASGGYWISMSANEIWASPTTLTGSIGVGGLLPTVPRLLDRIGIHVDGIGTTDLAGQLDVTRELGPDADQWFSQSVNRSYAEFIMKVAEARNREVADIDAVARGRVWIAGRALDHDLIDRIGNIDDAVVSAAELAGLAEGEYTVRYIERELDFAERLALELLSHTGPVLRALDLRPKFSAGLHELLEIAAEPLKWVDRLNDPKHIYAYCFCDTR